MRIHGRPRCARSRKAYRRLFQHKPFVTPCGTVFALSSTALRPAIHITDGCNACPALQCAKRVDICRASFIRMESIPPVSGQALSPALRSAYKFFRRQLICRAPGPRISFALPLLQCLPTHDAPPHRPSRIPAGWHEFGCHLCSDTVLHRYRQPAFISPPSALVQASACAGDHAGSARAQGNAQSV